MMLSFRSIALILEIEKKLFVQSLRGKAIIENVWER